MELSTGVVKDQTSKSYGPESSVGEISITVTDSVTAYDQPVSKQAPTTSVKAPQSESVKLTPPTSKSKKGPSAKIYDEQSAIKPVPQQQPAAAGSDLEKFRHGCGCMSGKLKFERARGILRTRRNNMCCTGCSIA